MIHVVLEMKYLLTSVSARPYMCRKAAKTELVCTDKRSVTSRIFKDDHTPLGPGERALCSCHFLVIYCRLGG